MIEHEIKLRFDSFEAARQAVTTAGGRLVVSRRLVDDRLFDTADQTLRQRGEALRVRHDSARGFLTFKGRVQPSTVKSREEIEVVVGDAGEVEDLLRALGYRCWFRAQKYREEYDLDRCTVMLDETPIGVFMEIEGPPEAIAHAASTLGRSSHDYVLDSYPRLFFAWCESQGRLPGDMLFDA